MQADPAGEPASQQVEALLATPSLAEALNNEHFRRFLDQVPVALILAAIHSPEEERIIYANPEFARLTGQPAEAMVERSWSVLAGIGHALPKAETAAAGREAETTDDAEGGRETLDRAITSGCEARGTFRITPPEAEATTVDVYANVIEDEDGRPAFRLAALADVTAHHAPAEDDLAQALKEKDTLLREVQHRVKNNLQMITALIRIEARNAARAPEPEAFARLAGRIEAIQLLYELLSDQEDAQEVDLGIYLTRVASAVLKSQAAEGIRLDCRVDVYPVPVNIAMPTGLVVNELLTNALKHAFAGREIGTITLHSVTDGEGCLVLVADDGNGMPEGTQWPQRGKLSHAIVQSLKENARATVEVASSAETGTRVSIRFSREDAAAAG